MQENNQDIQAEITLKEVYKKVVQLEVKFELEKERNAKVTKKFTNYVWILIILGIINVLVHVFAMFLAV